MADAVIKPITGTASDDALHGACQVWGLAVEGSLSATAFVRLHDNVSSTGTIVAQIQTNIVAGTGAGAFEIYREVMFPRPVRIERALSVTASAGVARYWVYIGGR